MSARIVIATPHRRFDPREARLRQLPGLEVARIREREGLTADALAAFRPDYVFFPHWSWKIPAEVYEAFPCVIFHMTDLPFGRGGSPLQNLIVRGFESTKLSALRCVAELDAGPVYLKRDLSLLGTAEEVLLRASDLMVEMIEQIVAERPSPVPQEGEPTPFRRRTPADGALSHAATLPQAHDLIRMLDAEGYPRAFLDAGPFRLEFSRASLTPDSVLADVRIRLREESE